MTDATGIFLAGINLPAELNPTKELTAFQRFVEEATPKVLEFGVRAVVLLILFLVGAKLIGVVRKFFKKYAAKARLDVGVVTFLDSCIKVGLYAVLIFFIAVGFGLNAATTVALLGSAGVAIGLAVQGSLSNFAGGVIILMARPFVVGDYISARNYEGKVFEISILYTKLVTMDNSVEIIPNGVLSNSEVVNMTTRVKRKQSIIVGISYDSDIRKAKDVLGEMLKHCENILSDEDNKVVVDELADSSVNLKVLIWTLPENYYPAKWEVTEKIKLTLDENGITIPFPQMDVHLDKED